MSYTAVKTISSVKKKNAMDFEEREVWNFQYE